MAVMTDDWRLLDSVSALVQQMQQLLSGSTPSTDTSSPARASPGSPVKMAEKNGIDPASTGKPSVSHSNDNSGNSNMIGQDMRGQMAEDAAGEIKGGIDESGNTSQGRHAFLVGTSPLAATDHASLACSAAGLAKDVVAQVMKDALATVRSRLGNRPSISLQQDAGSTDLPPQDTAGAIRAVTFDHHADAVQAAPQLEHSAVAELAQDLAARVVRTALTTVRRLNPVLASNQPMHLAVESKRLPPRLSATMLDLLCGQVAMKLVNAAVLDAVSELELEGLNV